MLQSFDDLIELGKTSNIFQASPNMHSNVVQSYELTKHLIQEVDVKVYGIHTGFGSNVTTFKNASDFKESQFELLKYLQVGFGEKFSDTVVRRALRLQAVKVGQGFSGIHPKTFAKLVEISNSGQLPKVPKWGSLGASGDLIPMAHAVQDLFIEPNDVNGPRDIIGLVNTNSMMASFAIECLSEIDELFEMALLVSVLNASALGYKYHSSERFFKKQPQLHWLKTIMDMLQVDQQSLFPDGAKLASRPIPVQERYSIRCAPQVLGNVLENLDFARIKIEREALSVADNPIVDIESSEFIHGGLFYTAPLATAADLMTDSLSKLADMIDRQLLILMDPVTSHGLPENLKIKTQDHLKGIHQMVSSLVQGIRTYSMPARTLSFSCEGNNQDIVPATMTALINCEHVVKLAREVVRSGLFCALRAYLLAQGSMVSSKLSLMKFDSFNFADAEEALSEFTNNKELKSISTNPALEIDGFN